MQKTGQNIICHNGKHESNHPHTDILRRGIPADNQSINTDYSQNTEQTVWY